MGSYETCNSDSISDASFFAENKNVGDSARRCSGKDNAEKHEFGNFQDTGDWIECESTSCPGQTYFFNLRTQCSTWTRPVSQHVRLQHFRRKPRIYDNSFTCDPDNPSMIVSESEEDYCSSATTEKVQKDRDFKKTEVLSRLYYGVDAENFSDDKKIDYSDESVCNFSCGSYHYEDIWYDSSFYEFGQHFLTRYIDFIDMKISKGEEGFDFPMTTTDFLEVEFHAADNALEITERSGQSSSEDDVSLITEKPIIFTTSSSEEDEVDDNRFVPRLPKIKTKYLLRNMPLKRRMGGRKKKQTPLIRKRSRPTKIVCEMYGTKTINYDSTEAEVPLAVKQSNLTDSSVTSSLWPAENGKPAVWDNFELPGIDSGAKDLSSESSSSACSTCSCCSMTSETSTSSSVTDTSKGG